MRNKSALLGGAALGVLLSVGLGATADAKTAKHHHAAPAQSVLEQKVETLSAAVSDLEVRLNEESQARAALQAQAQSAQADAAAAKADAAAAHAQLAEQIQTIPGSVQGAVNTAIAANKPKPSWADNTTVGGTVFANASYINQAPRPTSDKSNVLNKNQNGFNYDIKRFYISIDHKFNDVFSANLTTDFTYDNATVAAQTLTSSKIAGCTVTPSNPCTVTVSVPTLVTGDKVTQLYIKKAFLQAKVSDALIFRLGSADLPWVPFVEGLYGNRYVENVIIDRTKYGTSADWGIHVLGALPASKDLTFNYAVSAVNGMGYKTPGIGTANRSNSMDVEGRVSATYDKKATVAIGGYVGKLGQAVQGISTHHNAERFDALAVYVDPKFRIGGEYFWASAYSASDILSTSKANTAQGWSAFGQYNVTPKVALFGRYDWVQPKSNTSSHYTDNYFNLGVSYEPVKTVDLALVYKRDAVANGSLSTSNGTIGAGSGKTGTYDEVGIWTQYKW